MSYKSLLFCPDERAARAVTQILGELDFTVESATEPFAAVKTLSDEHFDALVVDCANEQDASLLFKAARNSSQNHSSLSVAVVEGQAGVAKAFRIGANLVLTKPINIEQSKGTLRVARGLLRKGQAKPAGTILAGQSAGTDLADVPANATATEIAAEGKTETPLQSITPAVPPTLVPIMQSSPKPVAAAPVSPFSAFELEKDTVPETEAADAAVLESLPDASPKAEPPVVTPFRQAEPIAASPSGQAVAAAPALQKKSLELGVAGAAPMFTNEPIIKKESPTEPSELPAPTFSSLDAAVSRESGGGSGFLKVAFALLVLAVAGYFGWQKVQPLQYLHRNPAEPSAETVSEPTPAENQPTPVSVPPAPTPNTAATAPASPAAGQTPTAASQDSPTISVGEVESDNAKHASSPSNSGSQTIELQELPLAPNGKATVTMVTIGQKPQPIKVKSDPGNSAKAKPAQLIAPSVQIAESNNSQAALANLTAGPIALPKTAPETLRVSQGVSQGLLLKKVAPVYPPEALRLHKQGVVQLLATVSKSGSISNVKVLGGDPTLAQAAADAVLRWKYRPYLLNGEPVEIETQINVMFKAPQ